MIWRRGLVCLGLICALQIQPLTVLADGSFAQADLTSSAVQADPEGPIVQVDPAFWFTLLTAALACIAAMLALHRNRCHEADSAADRENHDDRS